MPICSLCTLPIANPAIIEGQTYCLTCFSDQFVICHLCQSLTPRDSAMWSDRHFYCMDCYNQLEICDFCGRPVPISEIVVSRHQRCCARCYENQFATCAECHARGFREDMQRQPDDRLVCQGCFDNCCVSCSNCDRLIWQDDARYNHDLIYCEDCAAARHREWDSQPFICETPTFGIIGSTRKFGVELETSACPDHTELRGNTIWECKSDCSIEGMEFVSPVLYGDQGLDEIKDFCAEARRRRWRMNRYCGYHAHFDVTTEDWEALRSIAYAYRKTFDLWCCFVSDSRSSNAMCGSPDYDLSDIERIGNAEDWDYFVGARDRFEFVNWRAYLVHGTVEVRSHDASLRADEICNWIRIHARFMDFVKEWNLIDLDDYFEGDVSHKFEAFASIVGPELADYYARRAASFDKPVRAEVTVNA